MNSSTLGEGSGIRRISFDYAVLCFALPAPLGLANDGKRLSRWAFDAKCFVLIREIPIYI